MVKRGVEWEAAVEGESNSVEQWEKIVKKWYPFYRQLASILGGMEAQNRAGAAQEFSQIGGDEKDDSMQLITNLASLSDEAFQKIQQALNNTK